MALILNEHNAKKLFIAYDHNCLKMDQYAPEIETGEIRYVNHDHLNGSDYFWLCAFDIWDNIPDRILIRKPYAGEAANVSYGKPGLRANAFDNGVYISAAAWLKKTSAIKLYFGDPGPTVHFGRWAGAKNAKGERKGW